MKTIYWHTLALIFLLSSCKSDQDDFISKYCPGSCTVIEGTLTTDNGTKPVPGVQLQVVWTKNGTLNIGGITRKKAIARTDQNGKYKLSFLLRDDEIPGQGFDAGDFVVKADVATDTYLTCYDNNQLEHYPSLARNTTYQLDYLLPQKAFVVVEASNLSQLSNSDYFATRAAFRSGVDGSSDCGVGIFWQNTANTATQTLEVAANQQVTIITVKRKNNSNTVSETTVNLQPGQTANLQVSF